MGVENTGLRACNVELISRVDTLAGQMEVMQRRKPNARQPIPDAPSVRIPDVPARPLLTPRSATTPAPNIIVEVAPRPIIPPRGVTINVARTRSTPKNALHPPPASAPPTIRTPLNQSTPVDDVLTSIETEPVVLTPTETQPVMLTPVDDVLTPLLSTPPDVVGALLSTPPDVDVVVQTARTDAAAAAGVVQTATLDAALVTPPQSSRAYVFPELLGQDLKVFWKKAGEAAVSSVGGNSSKRKCSSEPQFAPDMDKHALWDDGQPLGDYCEILIESVMDKNVAFANVQKADAVPGLNIKTTSTLGLGKRGVHR
ncbi:hypothetical protein ACQ4PT_023687 [Festuca glaucescens]